MEIDIIVKDMVKDSDGWTVSVPENEAEEIRMILKSWRYKFPATYFRKKEKLVIDPMTCMNPTALFKAPPYKPNDYERSFELIENELKKYEKMPKSINVIFSR